MKMIYVVLRLDIYSDVIDGVGYTDNLEDAQKIMWSLREKEVKDKGRGYEKWEYQIIEVEKI